MAQAKWTFMVYMAGDNSLSDAGDDDLKEMRKVGSTADVNVLVQFDNAGDHGTRRFRVLKGGNDLLESMPENDSGDPNVLLDYVKWAKANYTADRYALVLWNHGGGWAPDDMDAIATEVKARGYSSREGLQRTGSPIRRVFFRPTLQTIMGQGSAKERQICCDDGSGHSLDTIELGKVLEKTEAVLGQKLDLLGMDACLMSNLEVAYQAQPYVNYIVGSEETEPGEGWPYDTVLSRLVGDPGLTTADLASHIVHAYVQFYRDRFSTEDVTQAALDLGQIGTLTTALDSLAGAMRARLPRAYDSIWKAHRRTKLFPDYGLADIGSFSKQMRRATRNLPIRVAAMAVTAAVEQGQGRFVVAEEHNGLGVAECSGVTVYLPNPLYGISQYYGDLMFSQERQWKPMLDKYVGT